MTTLKKIFYCLLGTYAIFATQHASAQQQDPSHWTFSTKKISATSFELHFTAVINADWHIYAQQQPKDAVAQPTVIALAKNPLVETVGKPKEIGEKQLQKLEEVGITQYYYTGKVDFVQTIKLKTPVRTNVTGTITYMTCTDEMCLPVKTIPFNVKISN